MGLTVTVAPVNKPISLEEAKEHLRIVTTDHDDYINELILGFVDMAEGYMNRAIVTQTLEYTLDSFPDEIILPRAPVQSITSIQYVDTDGATQNFSDYQADLTHQSMPRVKPSYGNSWPSTRDQYAAVTVTYIAGYGDGEHGNGGQGHSPHANFGIPHDIHYAAYMTVATWFEYREDVIVGAAVNALPETAKRLLDPYRIARV